MAATSGTGTDTPGPGVDKEDRPVVDPTKNVLDLVDAAVSRLNDLRDADLRFVSAEIRHLAEMAVLRAQHEREMATKETERVDAIRSVDAQAARASGEDAATRATTLAAQVATAADVVRTQLATALEPINTALADLRRAQYEAQGQKTQVIETRQTSSALYAAVGFGITLILAVITILGVIVANGGQ